MNKYFRYVKRTGKTYLYNENGTIIQSYGGYYPLRCEHGFYLYPKIEKDFSYEDEFKTLC